jgi:GT2 family glycosyltransferase
VKVLRQSLQLINVNTLSIIIPTYKRERVLLDTINYLLKLEPAPAEILIIDQTGEHESDTARTLEGLNEEHKIRWIRLAQPSITHAMNTGLVEAHGEIVLFLDDDIIPDPQLVSAHLAAHSAGHNIVAGQVLQPGEEVCWESSSFQFSSGRSQYIAELMGGNFSIKRDLALGVGGFDENFVHVAYRFEAEFAARALFVGERIFFEPAASIHHLKEQRGGTRSFGHHLTTVKPSHSVGAYYHLLRAHDLPHRFRSIVVRPLRAVRTTHHLTHPWWILPTFIAEIMGLTWAAYMSWRGPRLIKCQSGERFQA